MSWERSDSDPVGDIKRAMERMRDTSYRPSVMVVHPLMMEWPTVLIFKGYSTLDRTRPWPRIVLFPRWDALKWRVRRYRHDLRWWWEDRRSG